MDRDPSLDVLLELDGQVLVIDQEAGHWVRFTVRRVFMSGVGQVYDLPSSGPKA